ncbi:MAG TPA: ABC transporter permease [Clostridiaceae bacterium]|nr:ABC transporter permease [Clostridiaceae bacterium]
MKNKISAVNIWNNYNTYMMFILLFVICVFASPNFFSPRNLMNIGRQYAALTFVSMGMLFVIITGGIDLSVGSILALGCVMTATILTDLGWPLIPSLFAVLIIGLIVGLFSGVLVAYFNFAPFIATLATMTIARGIAFMISNGAPIQTPANTISLLDSTRIFGIPLLIVMSAIIVIIFVFLQRKTVYGRILIAIGSNEDAVRLSGIRVKRYKLLAYGISGALAAFAGAITTSRSAVGSPLVGSGLESDAIAACVIGGASLAGGMGNPFKTLIGVLILALISNIMNLLAVPSYPQDVMKGLIIIFAVLIQSTNVKYKK